MSDKREFKYGDTITAKKESGEETQYTIGSAIGDWEMSLSMPGVGMCGLYRKADERKAQG